MSNHEAKHHDEGHSHYLPSSLMEATALSLSLAARILKLDIVELWSGGADGSKQCIYVYVNEEFKKQFPNINTGYFPKHKKKHVISPTLCKLAEDEATGCIWKTYSEDESKTLKCGDSLFPHRTEISYLLEGDTGGSPVYIVGFATNAVDHTSARFKFLKGIAYAVYVAAFDLAEEERGRHGDDHNPGELDDKKFAPRPISTFPSHVSLVNLAGSAFHSVSSLNNLPASYGSPPGIQGAGVLATSQKTDVSDQHKYIVRSVSSDNNVGMFLDDQSQQASGQSPGKQQEILYTKGSSSPINKAGSQQAHTVSTLSESLKKAGSPAEHKEDKNTHEEKQSSPPHIFHGAMSSAHQHQSNSKHILPTEPLVHKHEGNNYNASVVSGSIPIEPVDLPPIIMQTPTWLPLEEYHFPVAEIPVKSYIPEALTTDMFRDLKHIADGSNANIFLGRWENQKVIIKLIKEEVMDDAVAQQEFDLEHGMLSRISHPNIIRILGAGLIPRKFIVLEWLSGGALTSVLKTNQNSMFPQNLFKKPAFTYPNLLEKARDMAEALDYLHRRCHPGATVIHRDLKPDNIGFAADGTLKLFDFGLVTCVKARRSATEAYELTGYTGSLRYMAPEVAMREPYNEKVDVHSYGIILWQMARNHTPFRMGKEDYMHLVVRGGMRPPIERSWPEGFSNLLTACWHANPVKRPSFDQVMIILDGLIRDVHPAIQPARMSSSDSGGISAPQHNHNNPNQNTSGNVKAHQGAAAHSNAHTHHRAQSSPIADNNSTARVSSPQQASNNHRRISGSGKGSVLSGWF